MMHVGGVSTKHDSALMIVLFWCLLNKHQNNTRVSAEAVRHESTYIILFLTLHKESTNDDKNDDLYTSRLTCAVFVLLMTSQAMLITSQWPGNCDAIT